MTDYFAKFMGDHRNGYGEFMDEIDELLDHKKLPEATTTEGFNQRGKISLSRMNLAIRILQSSLEQSQAKPTLMIDMLNNSITNRDPAEGKRAPEVSLFHAAGRKTAAEHVQNALIGITSDPEERKRLDPDGKILAALGDFVQIELERHTESRASLDAIALPGVMLARK